MQLKLEGLAVWSDEASLYQPLGSTEPPALKLEYV